MSVDEWAIGQRIASHRQRRRLTQEELAGLVGISLSMMKKIESGDRLVTRFSQLILFAQVLRIRDLRDLTGVPLPLMPDGLRGHTASDEVRLALADRGRMATPGPVDLVQLGRRVEKAWSTWQEPSAFRYDIVGQMLPGLIRDVERATRKAEPEDRGMAFRLSSKLYQLTRTWTKRVGESELSLIAADRAVSSALNVDDPDLAAAAEWNLGMILSYQGKTEHALAVVRQAIEELEASLGTASIPRLAAFGGLHLLAAAEFARADKLSEAGHFLDTATRIARRTGETNHYRMVFGPVNVALHRVSTAIELGRTKDALDLAASVAVEDSPSVERRLTFHMDLARCYARQSNDVAAVHMLHRVYAESPEELRYNPTIRETVRQVARRAKATIAADLRPLVAAGVWQSSGGSVDKGHHACTSRPVNPSSQICSYGHRHCRQQEQAMTTSATVNDSCLSCLGAGWKFVRSRVALRAVVLACRPSGSLTRRSCSECAGLRVAGSVGVGAHPRCFPYPPVAWVCGGGPGRS